MEKSEDVYDGKPAPVGKTHTYKRGQQLVEFALILPLLLLLLFGIIDFGIAVWKYDTIANIGREIARYGVVHPDEVQDHDSEFQNGDYMTFVNETFTPEEFSRWTTGLITSNLGITPTIRESDGTTTTLFGTVNVTISYKHRLLTGPVIQAVSGSPEIHMRTVTNMNLEFPPQD